MPLSKTKPLPPCPVEQAIQVMGGKWKLLLLRSLLLNGPQRYNELLASVSGISAKELTRNLGALSASGFVTPGPGARNGSKPYALTPLGEGLMPTFQSLLTWGQKLLKSATNIPVR
jgi:DNA-binding HxlR family transcriptional regulator